VNITKHAVIRLNQRCRLTEEEIRFILENDKCCPIGIDDKRQRKHQLVWSEKDDQCFVIVQDADDQDVITVLPINYHGAWIIHQDAIEMAKQSYYGKDYVKRIELEEITKDQIALEKQKHAKVKKISINVNKIIIQNRNVWYKKEPITSKKSVSQKVCTFSNLDLVNMGFPRNKEIGKESILEEYKNNSNFAGNLDNLIRDNMAEQSIDNSDLNAYDMVLHERGQQFPVKIKEAK